MSLYPKKHNGRASVEIERGSETHSVMPARPPMGRDNGGIQALDRAFLILDIIADAGGEAKLTEIAGIAGLNVSTCHHLISTLYNWGCAAGAGGVARGGAQWHRCLSYLWRRDNLRRRLQHAAGAEAAAGHLRPDRRGYRGGTCCML